MTDVLLIDTPAGIGPGVGIGFAGVLLDGAADGFQSDGGGAAFASDPEVPKAAAGDCVIPVFSRVAIGAGTSVSNMRSNSTQTAPKPWNGSAR